MYRVPLAPLIREFNLSNINKEVEDAFEWEDNMGIFLVLIAVIESVILLTMGKDDLIKTNDCITSFMSVMLDHMFKVCIRWYDVHLHVWVFKNYALVHLPWNSITVVLIHLLVIEFLFYWYHRACHEVNILWAAHQVHHTSEYFSYSMALRKGFLYMNCAQLFYLPALLIFPPQLNVIHATLNLVYQFSLHTEYIGKFGPLEHIFNTPSHHRIHHARNPYCIDKNYGGILIIWDKLFGTFAEEKKTEKLAYGLVHNVNTFNQFQLQLSHYKNIFLTFISMNNYRDKLKTIFYGPGWTRGQHRLGNFEDIPQVQFPINKYDPFVPKWLKYYLVTHELIMLFTYLEFLDNIKHRSSFSFFLYVAFFLFSIQCSSFFWDCSENAERFELIRLVFMCFYTFGEITDENFIFILYYNIIRLINIISIRFWLTKIFRK